MNYLPTPSGSFRLFQVVGITVYMHWSWLIAAVIAFQRQHEYSSILWNVLEYLALFSIVLLHEFGHSLACRSVGGVAQQIVLWPLGGVAYVQPPPRPGAFLWSIAAGPLVNLLLVPVTVFLWWLCPMGEVDAVTDKLIHPDVTKLTLNVMFINIFLFVFNVLPIYPLDGGQILQSLLWFVTSRSTSIIVASVIGIVGGVGLGAAGLFLLRDWWAALISLFIILQAWNGLQYGLALRKREQLPRHAHLACPSCGAAPIQGPYWQCGQCGAGFDIFVEGGTCPNCSARFGETACLDCRAVQPLERWYDVSARKP